jgi:molybdopterin/thiamine biosynthesis adenylyltransferase
LLTLARLGIEKFSVAEFDHFELHNMNRQVGCTMSSLGKPKIDVMMDMARDINPDITFRVFDQGVNDGNVVDFLRGADVYVDGLDYFVLPVRRKVFMVAEALGIPALTAAPLGMGTSFLYFKPGGMNFDQYFDLRDDDTEIDQYMKFTAGISPSMLMLGYLVDKTAVDFHAQRGPSTGMACQLCAGVLASQVLKIVLARGSVPCVPRVLQFDAYNTKFKIAWRPWGNRNPWQRVVILLVRQAVLQESPLKRSSVLMGLAFLGLVVLRMSTFHAGFRSTSKYSQVYRGWRDWVTWWKATKAQIKM